MLAAESRWIPEHQLELSHVRGRESRTSPPAGDWDACLLSVIASLYINKGKRYLERHGRCYWDAWREHEEESERYPSGMKFAGLLDAGPLGEREVRGYCRSHNWRIPKTILISLLTVVLSVIDLYRELGTHALNLSLFFDKNGPDHGFRAFCSIISRINPNSRSLADSAFMERLHLEPVILTLPERSWCSGAGKSDKCIF